jgi:signal transduction histidine kinase
MPVQPRHRRLFAVLTVVGLAVAVAIAGGRRAVELFLLAAVIAALVGLVVRDAVARTSRWRRRESAAARSAAVAAERARLARDMHDSLGKTLDALALGAAALPTTLDEPGQARKLAITLRDATEHAVRESRDLIGGLREAVPQLLDRASIVALCEQWAGETGIAVDICVDEARALDITDETAYELAWILREALRNVAAHAHARRVSVGLDASSEAVTLIVADDGRGFAATPLTSRALTALQQAGHLGLIGMAERASICGGSFDVASSRAGTRVTVIVPTAASGLTRGWSPGSLSKARVGSMIALSLVAAILAVVVLVPDHHPSPGTSAHAGMVPSQAGSALSVAPSRTPLPSGGPSASIAPTGVASGHSTAGGTSSGVKSSAGPVAVGGAPVTRPPRVQSTIGCRVAYALTDQWDPGFIAQIDLTNTATRALSGWTLQFDFPDGQKMTSSWSGIDAVQSGRTVRLTGTSEHTTIAAGQTISVFVQGVWTSTDHPPTRFTINGTICS